MRQVIHLVPQESLESPREGAGWKKIPGEITSTMFLNLLNSEPTDVRNSADVKVKKRERSSSQPRGDPREWLQTGPRGDPGAQGQQS